MVKTTKKSRKPGLKGLKKCKNRENRAYNTKKRYNSAKKEANYPKNTKYCLKKRKKRDPRVLKSTKII